MNNTYKTIGIIVAIIIIIGLGYWYLQANPMPNSGTDTATTTTQGGSNNTSSSVTTNAAGAKTYTNFKNKYAVNFPAEAQNNLSNPDNVTFSLLNGTTTTAATLRISVGTDVTHLAYCLVVPSGAKGQATTTINGSKFLTYTVSNSTSVNTGTTYYRLLHKEDPYESVCYDIQKTPQGSASLNTKLDNILKSITFI